MAACRTYSRSPAGPRFSMSRTASLCALAWRAGAPRTTRSAQASLATTSSRSARPPARWPRRSTHRRRPSALACSDGLRSRWLDLGVGARRARGWTHAAAGPNPRRRKPRMARRTAERGLRTAEPRRDADTTVPEPEAASRGGTGPPRTRVDSGACLTPSAGWRVWLPRRYAGPAAMTSSRLNDPVLLRRLLDVSRSVVSELDLEAVLRRVVEDACDITGARYGALGVMSERGDSLDRFITTGIDRETHAAIGDLPRGRGVLGVLITDPKPLRLSNVGSHPRSYGFPPAHPEMNTFLGMPILIRGEAYGNLYLTEKEGGQDFDEVDEEAVGVLADIAAVAIDNARLYQRVEGRREELERAVVGLEATTEIARAVGGETDLGRILELIAKRGRALVNARTVVIVLEDKDELAVAAAAGKIDDAVLGRRIPLEGSLYSEVL